MTQFDLVKPWRLVIALLPLLYGSLLLLGLPQSWRWLVLVGVVVLLAIMIIARLELPMLAIWPAFVGLFLLSVCICALIENVVDYAIVPFSDSDLEVMIAALVGCGFIGWGIQTTRQMMVE